MTAACAPDRRNHSLPSCQTAKPTSGRARILEKSSPLAFQWSIAAGTYSCRFTPGTAVAAHMAAGQLAEKLKGIAAKLVAQGWPIQGADQGGERYDHAAGLNEVRFFHPDDKARAEALAQELALPVRRWGGATCCVIAGVAG